MKRIVLTLFTAATVLPLFLVSGCGDSYYDEVFSTESFRNIIPERKSAELTQQWLEWKIENFLPELMRREKIDMWLVTRDDRDVYSFLVPAEEDGLVIRNPFFLAFYDRGDEVGVERLSVGNRDSFKEWGKLFPDQVFTLAESLEKLTGIIRERDPGRIAVRDTEDNTLVSALGRTYASRLVSSDDIRRGWTEYRTPQQIEAYKAIVDISHDILREAFSNKVITPNVTTANDVNWWVKQKASDLGLGASFGPTVMVWRSLEENKKYGDPEEIFRIDVPPHCGYDTVIRPGDVLSCDFGIRYLGLATDIQQVGYVLKEGETDVPAGLKEAMRQANRLQDIFAAEWKQGLTGNEILFAALKKAKAEGIRPEIYGHPMGSYAYRYGFKGVIFPKNTSSAGPSFGSEGLFDEEGNQLPTRRGELTLNYNTAYAMELDITYAVPEWNNQDIRIVLEEKAVFTEDKGCFFPGGRQTEFFVIR